MGWILPWEPGSVYKKKPRGIDKLGNILISARGKEGKKRKEGKKKNEMKEKRE